VTDLHGGSLLERALGNNPMVGKGAGLGRGRSGMQCGCDRGLSQSHGDRAPEVALGDVLNDGKGIGPGHCVGALGSCWDLS
jgi:hypothetical protein